MPKQELGGSSAMRTRHATVWTTLGLAALIALAPALAEARGGGSRSLGSRGDRTHQAPAPTQTAPTQARPMERSTAPAQPAARPAAAPAAAQGGFFQRNPFLGGMMAGLVGAGLIGMLMGGGFLGAGFAGMLGMLLQVALIGGLIYLAMAFFRRRRAAETPASAYAHGGAPDAPAQRSATPGLGGMLGGGTAGGGLGGMLGGGAPRRAGRPDEIGIKETDFQAFEQLLGEIQVAWSKGDMGRLKQLMTPEMAGYFAEELSANLARGIENHVEDGRLEQGDLSEAWAEGDEEYATVAMRFSLLDYGKRISDGQVVEGSATERTEATEIWTMVRSRGGQWILSAIQQVD